MGPIFKRKRGKEIKIPAQELLESNCRKVKENKSGPTCEVKN
jgi:hypothetical protein